MKGCKTLECYTNVRRTELKESKKVERDRVKARVKAEKLVDKMTVEEMVGQLKHDAPEIERLGVKAYNWWNEGLHGVARAGTATVFPQAIGLAATWNISLLHSIGNVIADEGRAKYNAAEKHGDTDIYKGLTYWAPNVNIFRDPRWGRGHETYGEDPILTSNLAVSFIQGMQGDGEYLKLAACAKHFAVHSGPEELRHSFDAKVNRKDLFETYLPAFEACVKEADVEAVMGAYNRTNGAPCCAHEELMQGILRDKWGFQGHFVSDCWAIRDFHEHHGVTNNGVQSSAKAINAGCDLNCGCTYLCLLEAYKKQFVKKKTIREAAVRLFTTRYLLGMFEHTVYDKISYMNVGSMEHHKLAQNAAEESIVLLKNNGILPLRKDTETVISVIGPNADSRKALEGNYHGTSGRYVTALEGIRNYAEDEMRVLYAPGCHLFKEKTEPLARSKDRLSEALAAADVSNIVILCLGLDETMEGEEGDTGNAYASGDKKDLSLPKSQQTLMEAVLDCGKPVIVCMFAGSAMDLSYAEDKAAAVVQSWYPGEAGGTALANILFGEVSPSGKLPVTFYRDMTGLPEFEDYSMRGRTYRYLTKAPLYPFGYGLTYGKVQLKNVDVVTCAEKDKPLSVHVLIENKGFRATKDVVEVYIKHLGSRYDTLHPSLCAFCKVEVYPGKQKNYEIQIPAASFHVIDEDGNPISDFSESIIYVGTSGPDERSRILTGNTVVERRIIWKGGEQL